MRADPIERASLDRCDRGEMEAPCHALHRLGNRLRIRDIASNELRGGRTILKAAARQIVQNSDLMPRSKERIGEM